MKTVSQSTLERARAFEPKPEPNQKLRQRIDLLDASERALVRLAMSGSASRRRIAELLQVEPGTVTRRLQRIGARLHDPVVARLLDDCCPLGPDYRQIGVEHFLTGHTIERIARGRGITRTAVRQAIEYVRAWHALTK